MKTLTTLTVFVVLCTAAVVCEADDLFVMPPIYTGPPPRLEESLLPELRDYPFPSPARESFVTGATESTPTRQLAAEPVVQQSVYPSYESDAKIVTDEPDPSVLPVSDEAELEAAPEASGSWKWYVIAAVVIVCIVAVKWDE